MSNRLRQHAMTVVRLAVCAAALTWVLYNVTYYDHVRLTDGSARVALAIEHGDGQVVVRHVDGTIETLADDQIARTADGGLDIRLGLRRTVLTADHMTLVLCILVFAPVPLLQSWRFQLMLRIQDIHVSFWEAAKLCYAGNFFNFVTAVGSTGGDVLKMYYTSLHTSRKTEAVTTVFLDRIVGLVGVVSLVGLLMLTRIGDPKLAILRYGFVVLFAGCLIAALVVFSPRVRRLVKLRSVFSRLPGTSHWHRADAAIQRLADHKALTAASLALTFALQLIALTAMTLAAKALHMRWDPSAIWDYYTYLAAGIFVAAVPISPQGLGTMEAFYKFAFLPGHGSLAAILCLAMTVRALNLFWSLPGVLVALTGRHKPADRRSGRDAAGSSDPDSRAESAARPKSTNPRTVS